MIEIELLNNCCANRAWKYDSLLLNYQQLKETLSKQEANNAELVQTIILMANDYAQKLDPTGTTKGIDLFEVYLDKNKAMKKKNKT